MVKFSDKWKHVQERIKRMPKLVKRLADAKTESDAKSMIKTFQDGLRRNAFHLVKLKDGTIKRKKYLEYKLPDIPLYGKGDEKKDSYINALQIKKTPNGHRVLARKVKHWNSKLTLDHLLNIHELGITIAKKLNAGGTRLIRTPPRPLFNRAFKATKAGIKSDGSLAEIRKIIKAYLHNGSESGIKNFEKKMNRKVVSYAK